jgi:type II secretion system protein J
MSRHAGKVLRSRLRSGMTFIELILALAIASLVVTLVFSVYRTVSVTMQGQDERRRGADAAAGAVQRIARDIACTFAPESDAACAFTLEKGPASQLSFCTAVMPEGETDLRWFEVHRVSYRVGSDSKDAVVLFRENQPVAGPGAFAPPVTNMLASDVESFRVSVYDGSDWNDEWSSADGSCPRAARVELTAKYGSGTRTFQTEVLIPVGNPVTSTLTRASVPATP